MSVIMDWGNAYENMTPEAIIIKKKLSAETLTSQEEKIIRDILFQHLLDITDTRKICVVVSNEDNIPCIRHIFRVEVDAEKRLDELKKEYYQDYAKLPSDKFVFFTGYHKAEEFCKKYKE